MPFLPPEFVCVLEHCLGAKERTRNVKTETRIANAREEELSGRRIQAGEERTSPDNSNEFLLGACAPTSPLPNVSITSNFPVAILDIKIVIFCRGVRTL